MVVCSGERDFLPSIRETLESSSVSIAESAEEITADSLIKRSEDGQSMAETYDVAVFSNVLNTVGGVEDGEKRSQVATALLALLKPNGVAVVREDLSTHPARLIAQLTQFFDLFAAEIGDHTVDFQFYSMNQLQAAIATSSNFLDVYW